MSKQLEAFGALKCELVMKGSAALQISQHKCGREARRWRVIGSSYEAVAVLCRFHALRAKDEGFTLQEHDTQSADPMPLPT